VTRGPHEHREQTDWFVFTGPGTFEIHLWDNHPESATFGHRQTFVAGDECPMCVIVPPGVVHGYQNISSVPGLVVNCPDRLFAGWNRSEPVDEIRHEEDTDSEFVIVS
jgi:dTDP-4-dehydrorhamnose 3,5-epimerase